MGETSTSRCEKHRSRSESAKDRNIKVDKAIGEIKAYLEKTLYCDGEAERATKDKDHFDEIFKKNSVYSKKRDCFNENTGRKIDSSKYKNCHDIGTRNVSKSTKGYGIFDESTEKRSVFSKSKDHFNGNTNRRTASFRSNKENSSKPTVQIFFTEEHNSLINQPNNQTYYLNKHYSVLKDETSYTSVETKFENNPKCIKANTRVERSVRKKNCQESDNEPCFSPRQKSQKMKHARNKQPEFVEKTKESNVKSFVTYLQTVATDRQGLSGKNIKGKTTSSKIRIDLNKSTKRETKYSTSESSLSESAEKRSVFSKSKDHFNGNTNRRTASFRSNKENSSKPTVQIFFTEEHNSLINQPNNQTYYLNKHYSVLKDETSYTSVETKFENNPKCIKANTRVERSVRKKNCQESDNEPCFSPRQKSQKMKHARNKQPEFVEKTKESNVKSFVTYLQTVAVNLQGLSGQVRQLKENLKAKGCVSNTSRRLPRSSTETASSCSSVEENCGNKNESARGESFRSGRNGFVVGNGRRKRRYVFQRERSEQRGGNRRVVKDYYLRAESCSEGTGSSCSSNGRMTKNRKGRKKALQNSHKNSSSDKGRPNGKRSGSKKRRSRRTRPASNCSSAFDSVAGRSGVSEMLEMLEDTVLRGERGNKHVKIKVKGRNPSTRSVRVMVTDTDDSFSGRKPRFMMKRKNCSESPSSRSKSSASSAFDSIAGRSGVSEMLEMLEDTALRGGRGNKHVKIKVKGRNPSTRSVRVMVTDTDDSFSGRKPRFMMKRKNCSESPSRRSKSSSRRTTDGELVNETRMRTTKPRRSCKQVRYSTRKGRKFCGSDDSDVNFKSINISLSRKNHGKPRKIAKRERGRSSRECKEVFLSSTTMNTINNSARRVKKAPKYHKYY